MNRLTAATIQISLNSFSQDLKLKFYEMMIQYALKHSAYLDAAKYWYKVWETPTIKEEVDARGRHVRIIRYLTSMDSLPISRLWNILSTTWFLHHMITNNQTCCTDCSTTLLSSDWTFISACSGDLFHVDILTCFQRSCKMLHNTGGHAVARY